ncbi:zinc ribbon domain-containing protein, partial [Escherichia coli]|nr:zinc ribbon domain-containing protein [Escherichia coli]
ICGSPMRVSYGRPRKDGSGRIYYYTCTMKANSGKARCNNPNVRGDKLEAIILTNLKKLDKKILLMELRTYAKTITPPLPKKELLQKRKQMNALLNNLSKVSNTNSSEFILSKINKLGEEITKLENKLNNLKNSKQCDFNSEILISSLDDFKTTFKLLDTINAKRCMLEAIIEKIEWNGFTKTAYINLWGSKNTAI